MWSYIRVASILWLGAITVRSQTALSVLEGTLDFEDGTTSCRNVVPQVWLFSSDQSVPRLTRPNQACQFWFPGLVPGRYRLRACFPVGTPALDEPGLCRSSTQWAAQEVTALDVPLATRVSVVVRFTSMGREKRDTPRQNVVSGGVRVPVPVFGPDLDPTRTWTIERRSPNRGPLDITVASWISPEQVEQLPLPGRDVYSLLALQPAVAPNEASLQGFGFSAAGQRPSSSVFLLDGVDATGAIAGGPALAVTPEATQELQIAVSGAAPEYGRSAGPVVNVISRAGGNVMHAEGYVNLRHNRLNANEFQANARRLTQPPLRQLHGGWRGGGAFTKKLFAFTSGDFLSYRSFEGIEPQLIRLAAAPAQSLSAGARLLTQFAPAQSGQRMVLPELSQNRRMLMHRLDQGTVASSRRIFGRFAWSDRVWPNFAWSPYPQMQSESRQPYWNAAVSLADSASPDLWRESRLALSRQSLTWDRPNPTVPQLATGVGLVLPASTLSFGFHYTASMIEASHTLRRRVGPHVVSVGGSLMLRWITAERTNPAMQFTYASLETFLKDTPEIVTVRVGRAQAAQGIYAPARPSAAYRQTLAGAFVEDSWKIDRRLTFTSALRADFTGSPGNADGKLYAPDYRNLGGKVGLSVDLSGTSTWFLRAASSLSYDRPFDQLWLKSLNNQSVALTWSCGDRCLPVDSTSFPDAATLLSTVKSYSLINLQHSAAELPLAFSTDLTNAYTTSSFVGILWESRRHWRAGVDLISADAKRLPVADIVHRERPVNDRVIMIVPSGSSDYKALAASLRYRGTRSFWSAQYTWSHSLDIQSELFPPSFDDFGIANPRATPARILAPALMIEGNTAADRGNSDFDLRHAASAYGFYELRGWSFASAMSLRSGFPYSVNAGVSADGFYNPRLSLAAGASPYLAPARDVTGGLQMLNPASFVARTAEGSTGRNVFRAPGWFSLDASVSRVFWRSERFRRLRVIWRIDAYNVLNHANLSAPGHTLGAANFGAAYYGRPVREIGFNLNGPLPSTARQLQLMLRVQF